MPQTETFTENQLTCRIVAPRPRELTHSTSPTTKTEAMLRKTGQKSEEPEDQGVYCDIVSPRNVRSHTPTVSPT